MCKTIFYRSKSIVVHKNIIRFFGEKFRNVQGGPNLIDPSLFGYMPREICLCAMTNDKSFVIVYNKTCNVLFLEPFFHVILRIIH